MAEFLQRLPRKFLYIRAFPSVSAHFLLPMSVRNALARAPSPLGDCRSRPSTFCLVRLLPGVSARLPVRSWVWASPRGQHVQANRVEQGLATGNCHQNLCALHILWAGVLMIGGWAGSRCPAPGDAGERSCLNRDLWDWGMGRNGVLSAEVGLRGGGWWVGGGFLTVRKRGA